MTRPHIPTRDLYRIFGDDSAIDVAEWLQREPPTWRDDVREFFDDIRANPSLAAIVFGFGLASGMLATVGVAYVIAWVAL